ncbi:hypothetical protein ARMGADRAFT_1031498 [Armillaria gallica]|uniref:Uncharacterized protein n=1 Tax=Armillaria gallica TaxID=47427 RepID=A0A2H3D9Z1_ARMGA|nr:hypothetical protein ARMGADRAFT_1031498 [Armillaria gallica]
MLTEVWKKVSILFPSSASGPARCQGSAVYINRSRLFTFLSSSPAPSIPPNLRPRYLLYQSTCDYRQCKDREHRIDIVEPCSGIRTTDNLLAQDLYVSASDAGIWKRGRIPYGRRAGVRVGEYEAIDGES